jgi:phosphatidate cytidylyltransferase
VITALVLFAAFLGALFYLPPLGWLLFVTASSRRRSLGVGGADAPRCSGADFAGSPAGLPVCNRGRSRTGGGRSGCRLRCCCLASRGLYFYLPAAVFWLLLVPIWLQRRWPLANPVLALATGIVLLLPVWLALIQLRQAGPLALLAIMAVVWLADIGAYFTGRSLGKHKLAPNISPGKTWEGAIGGGVTVLVYGLAAVIEAASHPGREPAAVVGASGAVDGDQHSR